MDIKADLFNLGVSLIDYRQKTNEYFQAKQAFNNAYDAVKQAESTYADLKLKIVEHLHSITQDWLHYSIYVYDPNSEYLQRRVILVNPLLRDKFEPFDDMTINNFNERYPYEYSEGEYYVAVPVSDFSRIRLNV